MATAFTRAMLESIKAKGGWRWIMSEIGSGVPLGKVAEQIIMPSGDPVSRAFLGNYMRRNKKLKELMVAAYKDAAGAHAELGLQILEEVSATDVVHSKEQLTKAKMLSEYHRWLAEKLDSEFFGTKKEAAANINLQIGGIGALHVHAMKEAKRIIAGQKVEAHVLTEGGDRQPVDAEIISEGDSNG